jgi:proteasome lid subunit RPN8/RPN11
MHVAISPDLLARIRAEAAASPDREICGLLFGTTDRIEDARALPNVAERPEDSFELDPARLIAAHRDERAGGARIIGCYHSHPNGSADPSPRDLAAAQPGSLWVIVGAVTRAWRRTEDTFTLLKLV